MKRLCLILAGVMVLSILAMGCQPSSHDRFRQMTYRRVADMDALGIQDDFDTAVLLTERPSHLSTWYAR